ncbi:MAG: hypothetical protein PHC34_06745 [Candidatus Gastranaerophilales bacterium]|nr:hypothetical protein [Candidatus Gastranaerophilales bacterium]
MQTVKIMILCFLTFIFNSLSSSALVKIDDNSIDLAIKYGIKMKGSSTENILSTNWVNDGNGRILNIYSPFIQIAMKSANKPSTGDAEEDLKMVKNLLQYDITKVKNKNEIRFIVAIYGDNINFAKNYKAYIIEANKFSNTLKEKDKINPNKSSIQKIADKDNFHPKHPFSGINCYSFKFDNLFKLKEYYFILVSDNKDEIKYKINNENIF